MPVDLSVPFHLGESLTALPCLSALPSIYTGLHTSCVRFGREAKPEARGRTLAAICFDLLTPRFLRAAPIDCQFLTNLLREMAHQELARDRANNGRHRPGNGRGDESRCRRRSGDQPRCVCRVIVTNFSGACSRE